MIFNELRNLVSLYNGNKICFLITGGGAQLAMLGTVAGSSRILHAMHMPWSEEALLPYKFNNASLSSSSYDGVTTYAKFLREHISRDETNAPIDIFVVSAALTTVYSRKGENRSFFALQKYHYDVPQVWKLTLPKVADIELHDDVKYDNRKFIFYIRKHYDQLVSIAAINILLHNNYNFSLENKGIIRIYN